MTSLLTKATENLKGNVKGKVVLRDDPNYEGVRKIWNAMIDRRPAVIVRCATADDVPTRSGLRARMDSRYPSGAQGITSRVTPCATGA